MSEVERLLTEAVTICQTCQAVYAEADASKTAGFFWEIQKRVKDAAFQHSKDLDRLRAQIAQLREAAVSTGSTP